MVHPSFSRLLSQATSYFPYGYQSWCLLHNVVCSSGHAIAVEALGAVMKAYDGRGPSTTLGEKILEELKLASAEDLLG